MAKANFRTSLKHVLVHEGGWADHPRDPGGATMKGVTLRTFRRFFGANKTKAQLRNITTQQLDKVYRTGYWNTCDCDDLPAGVDYAVFDGAVNSGPGRSARWLQAAVGAGVDGQIGPKTLAKTKAADPLETIQKMCDRRMAYLRGLHHWNTFGKGWTNRVEGVRATATEMAGGSTEPEPPPPPSTDFRTVKRGSRGLWVRKLQEALGIEVDGRFGKQTDKALRDYQSAHGLVVDGIAGRNTYRSMGLIA